MFARNRQLVVGICGVGLWVTGCVCHRESTIASNSPCDPPCDETPVATKTVEQKPLPALPNAEVGECFAEVWVPAETRTVTEKVCVKPASERVEITPAQYEWVDESVCIKDATKRLEEVPTEFTTEQRQIETQSAYTSWVQQQSQRCMSADGREIVAGPVFCLMKFPAQTRTVSTQTCAKSACVREVEEPAQYQIVRRQKISQPAVAHRVCVPAEYEEISKTVVVAPGRMEWRRAVCESEYNPVTVNNIKDALYAAGYNPGPRNGQFDEQFWSALRQYQSENGLAVGALTVETTNRLDVRLSLAE